LPFSSRNELQAPLGLATPQKVSACRRTKHPDCYRSKLAVEARHKNEISLIAAWMIVGERQNFLEQFIGKFLLLFKKRKMAGIVTILIDLSAEDLTDIPSRFGV
jgi:hypothetical protein